MTTRDVFGYLLDLPAWVTFGGAIVAIVIARAVYVLAQAESRRHAEAREKYVLTGRR